ncbi:uncharacterized protein F5891DRAFT_1193808 [Suillus fuscotomentosus]|uniref:Uncharacterized protein n=1 Tax=Suillus fuscotomentosus TaxID=1912939 RepID=A0AAD4HGK7_9AGAM|nr:uncharacterized protein F5891DRAFT_1193808 [Suillus fuscotomentosus]KAG1895798.1 hypothetical protein F5891DRAFT_1193808 [Suillus fuscotomentosus]
MSSCCVNGSSNPIKAGKMRVPTWPTQDKKPIWRLLNKSGQTLTVVDVAFPTGTDLMKHKGRDKASVSKCHLWFVTRNWIPDNVYESWNTQPVVAGSDSEHDDCSDVLLSDVDSLNDSFISKSDNELASSLMELELTDAEVEDPKGKGKMKVVLPKRTNMKQTRTVLSPEQSPSEVQRAIRKKSKVKQESANDVQAAIPLFFMESGPSTGSQPFPLTQLAQSNSLKTVLFRSSPLGVPAGTAIQFLKSKSALSSPPEFVSVSEADVLWRSRSHIDDPFAPEQINPWDSHYSMKPTNLQLITIAQTYQVVFGIFNFSVRYFYAVLPSHDVWIQPDSWNPSAFGGGQVFACRFAFFLTKH